MALYAFLRTDVGCPACGQQVTDEVWFAWGYCAGRAPSPASTYSLHDSVRWRVCGERGVLAWTHFAGEVENRGANLGSPDVTDLVVRDLGQTWLFGPCTHCRTPLSGGAIEIVGGRISRAWLARLGEFPADDVGYWSPDGTTPLWFADRPTDYVDDCGPGLDLWPTADDAQS